MASTIPVQLKELDLEIVHTIGKGTYGMVYKGKYLGSECAIKIVHAAPLSLLGDPKSLQRFEQECQFMNSLKHTNLVQSMGTATLDHPVLVMELMDCNLNVFLEKNISMGFQMEVSIADDIINGIRFLHHKKVVHRDISGANILMIGSRAKLSDLGMAKLLSAFQSNQLTPCPGSRVYMPFNAILDNPSYDEKIDIYSYGVVLIQILTKKLPNPSQTLRVENGLKIIPSEIERRQNHLIQISDNHPLKEVALHCLDDQERRPAAVNIQEYLEKIKLSEMYVSEAFKDMQIVRRINVLQVVEENKSLLVAKGFKDAQIQELEARIQQLELGVQQLQLSERSLSDLLTQEKVMREQKLEEDRQIMHGEFQKKLEEFGRQLQQKALEEIKENQLKSQQEAREIVQEKESKCSQIIEQAERAVLIAQTQVAEKNKQLAEEKQKLKESFHAQVCLKDQSNSLNGSTGASPSETSSPVARNNSASELLFNTDACTPSTKLHRDTAAVVNQRTIYVRPARTRHIYEYVCGDDWSFYCECNFDNCSLAIVMGSLVTIGGRSSDREVVSQLYRATAWGWVGNLPSMHTARELTLAITSGKTLVVVGGRDKKGKWLTVVEVFHEDVQQWQTACGLPFPLHFSSITTFDDSLIIHGLDAPKEPLHAMKQRSFKEPVVSLSCKLTDLICSCSNAVNIWKAQALDVAPRSSLVKFNHRLLAIGGQLQDGQATGDVFSYSQKDDNWIKLTSLNIPRYLCFTAVVSEYLYIIGGDEGSNNLTKSVEIGTYQ